MTNERLGILIGGAVLLLGGAFGLYLVALDPLAKIILSRNWTVTPCVIESSEVKIIRDGGGNHRTARIQFSYDVKEKHYQSTRHDFWVDGLFTFAGDTKLIVRFPAGTRTTCYINPDAANDAVLSREVPWKIPWGLIPLMLMAVVLLLAVVAVLLGRPEIDDKEDGVCDVDDVGPKVFAGDEHSDH